MSHSIRVSNKLMDCLKSESEAQSRSIAGQVQHWINIGKAIESSERFNYANIQAALTAKKSPDELTAEEQEVYHDEYMNSLWQVTPEQEAFYAKQVKDGKGVGLDDNENTIYQSNMVSE